MLDTRDKIIEAAVKCFRSNSSATLEEVAEEAGISRRTLHRHFKNRLDLMESCKIKMLGSCNKAMREAYESGSDSIQKVKNMLFAAIDQGARYAFVKQIYARDNYAEAEQKKEFESDNVKLKWLKTIEKLQKAKQINSELTVPWIFNLFGAVIETTISAVESGDVAKNDSKKFAWTSFKGAIGLKE